MEFQVEYGELIVFKFPGWTVNVERPTNLPDDERARRIKRREHSAAALLIEHYKRKGTLDDLYG